MTTVRDALADEDGENMAVRAFLLLYGGQAQGMTVKDMRDHMRRSGFPHWPAWVDAQPDSHLTKGGAQEWICHLLALAAPPQEPVVLTDDEVRSWAYRNGVLASLSSLRIAIEDAATLYAHPPAAPEPAQAAPDDMDGWYAMRAYDAAHRESK